MIRKIVTVKQMYDSARIGALVSVAARSTGHQASGQTRERRELLPALMVVAHLLSLGWVPQSWLQRMVSCAVVASGVNLGQCLLVWGRQPRRLLVEEGGQRVQTLYFLYNKTAFCRSSPLAARVFGEWV